MRFFRANLVRWLIPQERRNLRAFQVIRSAVCLVLSVDYVLALFVMFERALKSSTLFKLLLDCSCVSVFRLLCHGCLLFTSISRLITGETEVVCFNNFHAIFSHLVQTPNAEYGIVLKIFHKTRQFQNPDQLI